MSHLSPSWTGIGKQHHALQLLGSFLLGILATQGARCQELLRTAESISADRAFGERPEDLVAAFSGTPGAGSLVERVPVVAPIEDDPCLVPDIEPNSMSPTWNLQAGTVQCGSLETDSLATVQPLEGSLVQWTAGATAKYGLTPHLELRWALPGRVYQGGGAAPALAGTTDQLLGILYNFHEHKGWTPDLSFSYAIKLPTANPAKGFGTGYSDHMFTLVASRDMGTNHVDFNLVSTVAGGDGGGDQAIQCGAGLSHSFAHNLMGTVEYFGGPQPFTDTRYAGGFVGGSWGIRPWLALNGGWVRPYTADGPPGQYLMGFIYTSRPRLVPLRGSSVGKVLGR